MAQNWLIAVDDSVWASYAFNYATEFMDKKTDHLYLMHVMEEPTRVFVGYATPNLIDSMQKLEDEKARKILVHYGHKAKDLGVRVTFVIDLSVYAMLRAARLPNEDLATLPSSDLVPLSDSVHHDEGHGQQPWSPSLQGC